MSKRSLSKNSILLSPCKTTVIVYKQIVHNMMAFVLSTLYDCYPYTNPADCIWVLFVVTASALSPIHNMVRLRRLAWTLISVLLLYTTTTTASVLAIDYGTDFIKASLIKPGVAFDILLNRDSKRKIAASIAWKGDERLFGTDALNIVRISSISITHMRRGLTLASDTGSTLSIRVVLRSQAPPGCSIRFSPS